MFLCFLRRFFLYGFFVFRGTLVRRTGAVVAFDFIRDSSKGDNGLFFIRICRVKLSYIYY